MKRGGILWWTLAAGGFVLLVPAAWLCTRSAAWLTLFGPLLLVWSVWLIRDYMLWYRSLGNESPSIPTVRADEHHPEDG